MAQNKRWLIVALFAINGSFVANAEQRWNINSEVGMVFDSNLGKAQFLRDTVEDEIISLKGDFQYIWQPNMKSLLSFTAKAEAEKYDTVTKLDNFSAGFEIAYSWQHKFGYLAPFYRVAIDLKRVEAETNDRSADVISFQGFATKRLTTNLTGRLGYHYTDVSAEHEVFDNQEHRVFANLDYIWSQKLVSYGTLSVIQGDIYSTAQIQFCNGLVADDIYPLIKESKSIWTDEAFNYHFCGNWTAYRVEANTLTLNLGVNYALSHKYSIDVSATAIDSQVSNSVDYQRLLVRVGLLMRF